MKKNEHNSLHESNHALREWSEAFSAIGETFLENKRFYLEEQPFFEEGAARIKKGEAYLEESQVLFDFDEGQVLSKEKNILSEESKAYLEESQGIVEDSQAILQQMQIWQQRFAAMIKENQVILADLADTAIIAEEVIELNTHLRYQNKLLKLVLNMQASSEKLLADANAMEQWNTTCINKIKTYILEAEKEKTRLNLENEQDLRQENKYTLNPSTLFHHPINKILVNKKEVDDSDKLDNASDEAEIDLLNFHTHLDHLEKDKKKAENPHHQTYEESSDSSIFNDEEHKTINNSVALHVLFYYKAVTELNFTSQRIRDNENQALLEIEENSEKSESEILNETYIEVANKQAQEWLSFILHPCKSREIINTFSDGFLRFFEKLLSVRMENEPLHRTMQFNRFLVDLENHEASSINLSDMLLVEQEKDISHPISSKESHAIEEEIDDNVSKISF